MKEAAFRKILDGRLEKIVGVLARKAGEYATDGDRLHNFHRAAEFTGETPSQVCVGFFLKHLVSVLDIVEECARHDYKKLPLADEKIGDAINYLILLEALLTEMAEGA